MEDDITQSDLFQKLFLDAPAIEEEFLTFSKRYEELWQTDHEAKVTILQCHLILESFLTEYLKAANPAASRIGDLRLTFAQKADLAYHPNVGFELFFDGIKALNSLRNKIAHQLGYVATQKDLQPIVDCLKPWLRAGGYEMPEGIAIVSRFTLVVCMFIDGSIQSIKRHGGGAGLPGVLSYFSRKN